MSKCKRNVLLTICILLVGVCLTGCRFSPRKPKASDVEAVAKKCINDKVVLTDQKPVKEVVYAEAYYKYAFEDERGIPFTVFAATSNFAIVEPIPGLYSDLLEYRTDYLWRVREYYADEANAILDHMDILYRQWDSRYGLIIKIPYDTDFEAFAKGMKELDELYDCSFVNNGIYQDVISTVQKITFDSFNTSDVLVRVMDVKSGETLTDESKCLGQIGVFYSDQNLHSLSETELIAELNDLVAKSEE